MSDVTVIFVHFNRARVLLHDFCAPCPFKLKNSELTYWYILSLNLVLTVQCFYLAGLLNLKLN